MYTQFSILFYLNPFPYQMTQVVRPSIKNVIPQCNKIGNLWDRKVVKNPNLGEIVNRWPLEYRQ